VNTLKGLDSADQDVVSLFEILESSKRQIFLKVRLPGALPFIFSGLKIGAAVSVIGAVIGEWVGAREGLGYLMVLANSQLKIDLVFASIFLLSVIGVFFYAVIGLAEKMIVRW
jgi:ABC-type nitrate/sulfonate/bicarbonate transport system permease component